MAIPPLVLRIYADSTGVKKGVAQAQTQVAGLRATVQQNAGLIQQAFIGAVVVGIGASIKAASDLGEAMNKSNVVFGESAQAVTDFADDSAESFGIAKAEAYEAAASFGAMFDSAGLMEAEAARMSVAMTKLAADMGSFNNVPVVEMLEKLRGGLAGEAEPLRRFGVFISEARVEAEAFAMGMQQVNGKFTDAQKIQARYNIILQDTKKQQGDFGRTLGTSLPNQMKVLKAQLTDLGASFGQVLIPVLLDAAQAVNDIVGPLTKALDATKRFTAENELAADVVANVGRAIKEGLAPGMELVNGIFSDEKPMRTFQGDLEDIGDVMVDVTKRLSTVSNTAIAFRHAVDRGGAASTRFVEITKEKFNEWAAAAGANFDGVKSALDSLAGKAKLTADKIIAAFRRQGDPRLPGEPRGRSAAEHPGHSSCATARHGHRWSGDIGAAGERIGPSVRPHGAPDDGRPAPVRSPYAGHHEPPRPSR